MRWTMARRATLLIGVSILACLGGCATPSNVVEARDKVIENDNANASTAAKQLDSHDKGDHAAVSQTVQDISASNAALAQKMKEEEEKLRDAQFSVDKLTKWVQAGIGTYGQVITGDIGGAAKTVVDTVAAESQTKKDALAAGDAFKDALDDKFNKANAATAKVADKVDDQATKVASLEKRLGELPTDLQKKITDLKGTVDSDIETIRQTAKNPAELEAKVNALLTAKGFKPEDIDNLHKRFSSEEILAMLAGAGALGAGGGGLASRFGKSRAEPKLQEQSAQLKLQEHRLTQTEATLAAIKPRS